MGEARQFSRSGENVLITRQRIPGPRNLTSSRFQCRLPIEKLHLLQPRRKMRQRIQTNREKT